MAIADWRTSGWTGLVDLGPTADRWETGGWGRMPQFSAFGCASPGVFGTLRHSSLGSVLAFGPEIFYF